MSWSVPSGAFGSVYEPEMSVCVLAPEYEIVAPAMALPVTASVTLPVSVP